MSDKANTRANTKSASQRTPNKGGRAASAQSTSSASSVASGSSRSSGRNGRGGGAQAASAEVGLGLTLQASPEETGTGLHAAASVSQPDTVAAAAAQAAEMQRRLAEVERRERALVQREAQLHVQQQQAQGVASSSSAADVESVAVREDVRVAAVQPPELSYANASGGSALEDWLFKLEQLFTQTRRTEAAWQERVRIAQLHWDRHMSLWWAGCAEAAAAAGAPLDS